MSVQEDFLAVLEGRKPRHLPVVCRLDLWHRAAVQRGSLPAAVRQLSLDELQLHLGMGVSARQGCSVLRQFRPPVTYRREQHELELREWWDTPIGSLHRRSMWTAEDAALGMAPRIERYPVQTPEDYARFEQVMAHVQFTSHQVAAQAYVQQIGARGVCMDMLGANPAHELMLLWVGYERFYLDMVDYPEVVEQAIAAAEQAYERMWPLAAASPFPLVLHGVNFDSATTPPPLFRRCFLPYLQRFNRAMHAAGKRTVFHGDGDQSQLLDLLLEAEYDVADCLAVAPLGRLTLADALAAWRGRIVIWGGMPSPLLEAQVPRETFAAHREMLTAAARDGGVIVGIADQAMPGSQWERLAALGAVSGLT